MNLHCDDLWRRLSAPVRWLGVFVLLIITVSTSGRANEATAQSAVPSTDPNSVVAEVYRANEAWSEEGGWHWVKLSFDGSQRFTGENYDYSIGKPLPSASYVATRVKTLASSDPCTSCVQISASEQGPPVILGGQNNPALRAAYAHLDNGPRRQIESTNGAKRWTKGAWYLNYSPTTKTLFSWTWIPDDGGPNDANGTSELSTSITPSLSGLGSLTIPQPMTPGSRVFPLAGPYTITQPFGCVAANAGYASPSFCPPDDPSFHDGVDLGTAEGTPILAAASGIVRFAGVDSSNSSRNSMIVIELDGSNAGFDTIYMHWETAYVRAGDHVAAGQIIAAVGSIGYSTGPHLHFSVRVTSSNETIDPLGWLNGAVQFVTGSPGVQGAYDGVIRWQQLIERAAQAHGVPAALIAAIIAVESSGNPDAISPAGAQGLMQIMPEQLTRLGVPEALWHDPAANIDAGARYLAETLNSGGSLQAAAARYFGSGCDALGTCTQLYVNRVLTLYVYFTTWLSTGTPPDFALFPATTQAVPTQRSTPAAPNTPPPSPAATAGPTTPSPTTTASPTPPEAQSETPTPAATPSPTPTSTPSPTPSASPSSTPSTTAEPSPTASPTATTDPTPSPTTTASPTPSPTATATASPTASRNPTPGPTPSPSPSSTAAATSEATPSVTATPSPDPAPTPTPAPTPSRTPAATPSATSSPTATPDPTDTPVSTPVNDDETNATSGGNGTSPIGQCLIGPVVSELLPGGASDVSPPTSRDATNPVQACLPKP